MKYPNLLRSLDVGPTVLRNRLVMGSMHTGLEEGSSWPSGRLTEMAAFFAERAKGGVGLMVTGGIAPNRSGTVYPLAAKLTSSSEASNHKEVTEAAHMHDSKICMQILHAGRYAYHPFSVAPSGIRAPISPHVPKALSSSQVEETVGDFVRCALLAQEAGYDGVEIMGSEGYLINEFLVARTNTRDDEWGGDRERRQRFPLEIVRRIRKAAGDDFIIMYRLSMLDLVQDGSSWDDVESLARAVEGAGASIISTGIGWHEARVPTIAACVPRAGFSWVTKRLRGVVNVPLVATNRINMPHTAEAILAQGDADLVSLARPLLADPMWLEKAAAGREDEINTCIACNQACLDHTFVGKRASCLVNPRAAHEMELSLKPTKVPLSVAVVGAGPAGLACATTAASRGHRVTLFDSANSIGGQFNMAKLVPGKEEFHETLRYFDRQLQLTGVNQQLGRRVAAADLVQGNFDRIVLATGVLPRKLRIPGMDHPMVLSYVDVLKGRVQVGKRVAIIGAGGIGFDVAEFLHKGSSAQSVPDAKENSAAFPEFLQEWGIDFECRTNGGLLPADTHAPAESGALREIFLCQRREGTLGSGLGKTTGWIHRLSLRRAGVHLLAGVKYVRVDDHGLHIEVSGKPQVLNVDHVVICAGQEPLRDLQVEFYSHAVLLVHAPARLRLFYLILNLQESVAQSGKPVFLIGGAEAAAELDAKRAIDQGTRLAAQIEVAASGAVFNAPIGLKSSLLKMGANLLGGGGR
jgi:2,4-dienoyl-CoA reductase (NADPH2)